MIEDNNFNKLQVCYLINLLEKSKTEIQRAQWRVAYYRKVQSKTKGKDKLKEPKKKIEKARLAHLKLKKEHLALFSKLSPQIYTLLKSINGARFNKGFVFLGQSGRMAGACVGSKGIAEGADQYEAILAMENILK